MLGLAIIVALGGTISSLTTTIYDVLKKNLGSDYLFIPPSIAIWSSDLGANNHFAEQLKGVTGVEVVSTLRYAATSIDGQSISLMGINPETYPKISGLNFQENIFSNEDQAYLALGNERALIANGSFKSQFKVNVGDSIDLVTPNGKQTYRVIAIATDFFNAKVITAFISQGNMAADFVKTEDIFLQLNLKTGADSQAADQAIRAIASQYPQFTVADGRVYFKTIKAEFTAAFSAVYFLLAMLAIPSLIAMLNTLAIGVIERTRELGMLRAIGSTQKQVRRMVLVEALIMAGIGTAFGLAGGLYLGYMFVISASSIFPMVYAFPTAGILAAILTGLLFGALSAVVPSRQAARLEIVQGPPL